MTILNRRSVLAGGIGMAGLAAAPVFARSTGYFARHHLPIGFQLYTIASEADKDLEGAFARLAAIGYKTVELDGYHGRPPLAVRAAADKAGLKITSIHLMSAAKNGEIALDSDVARIGDELGILGIKDIVLPLPPLPKDDPQRPGEDFVTYLSRVTIAQDGIMWHRLAKLLNERASVLKREGLRLSYHNHNFEFAPIGNRTGFDILMTETDPRLVHFEIDAGWVAAAGVNPVALLKRYSGRFRQMHVKDILASTLPNFALKQDPTEVGGGMMDWPKLLPAAYQAGIRQFYVEQEPPFKGSRFDSLAKSFTYLTTKV